MGRDNSTTAICVPKGAVVLVEDLTQAVAIEPHSSLPSCESRSW